jgi:hypothetical protein
VLHVPPNKAGPAAFVTLEKMTMLRLFIWAAVALLAESCTTGANRYINGTEIPREKTLVYTSGAQSVTLGAVTATTLAASGAATLSGPVRFASAVTGVTAATAGTQGGAPIALTTALVEVGTVGTTGDSVTLPTGAPLGHFVAVLNNDSADSLDVFPGPSGQVNNEAADALYPLAAGKALACYSLTAGTAATKWLCAGP